MALCEGNLCGWKEGCGKFLVIREMSSLTLKAWLVGLDSRSVSHPFLASIRRVNFHVGNWINFTHLGSLRCVDLSVNCMLKVNSYLNWRRDEAIGSRTLQQDIRNEAGGCEGFSTGTWTPTLRKKRFLASALNAGSALAVAGSQKRFYQTRVCPLFFKDPSSLLPILSSPHLISLLSPPLPAIPTWPLHHNVHRRRLAPMTWRRMTISTHRNHPLSSSPSRRELDRWSSWTRGCLPSIVSVCTLLSPSWLMLWVCKFRLIALSFSSLFELTDFLRFVAV